MLQRGIETPDMDVRWVSSLSWYFLNFFGLNGLYRLILGSDNCELCPDLLRLISDIIGWPIAADGSKDMMMSPYANAITQGPAQPQDYNKVFKAERDNLELAEGLYKWSGSDVELRVLRKYGKIPIDS